MAAPSAETTLDGGDRSLQAQTADGANEPLYVKMLADDTLGAFWEFATTIRRTKSLADRESAKLRGTWLAPGLAVQKVHGWGLRSVRLICINASSKEQRERLHLFFQRDRWNLEGRLLSSCDPLDQEPRVLVKIPYATGFDSWVKHERRVLTELAGIEGVPKLAVPLYFEDIDVNAATYEYCNFPSIQEYLEGGQIMPQESTHSVLSPTLSTLAHAHALGWLHTDLGAKDVLIPQQNSLSKPSGEVSSPNSQSSCLVCGWSRAVHSSQAACLTSSGSIVDFAEALPVNKTAEDATASDDVNAKVESSGEACEDESKKLTAEGDAFFGCEAAAPSIYAAPEQFLTLFAGVPCVSPATDVYRAAGVAIMATCGNAPLGVQGKPVTRSAVPDLDNLRRLCKQAILRRSEESERGVLPTAEEVCSFATCLRRLVKGHVHLEACKAPELAQWFERALAREVLFRFQTANEAIQALDVAWSGYEMRLASEFQERQKEIHNTRTSKVAERRPRLVFEPPPELAEMTVL